MTIFHPEIRNRDDFLKAIRDSGLVGLGAQVSQLMLS